MLGDDLEAWLAESALMKRTFRNCAIIAGLIERRFPGRKNPGGRSRSRPTSSMTCCAATSPITFCCAPPAPTPRPASSTCAALAEMLSRIRGRIVHKALDHVSPLAVPVMLEIGRETVYGEAADSLLAEAEAELVKEAMQ